MGIEIIANVRTALVHDNFAQHGGAERVAEMIARILPEADVFSTVTLEDRLSTYMKVRGIQTTWMQRLPALHRLYRHYFLLYPFAVRGINLSAYDLVISSCVGFAKGVIRAPNATHICYCHTPTRWIWRFDDYSKQEQFSGAATYVLKRLVNRVRQIDLRAAKKPDFYIANSKAVAARIKQFYGCEATVVHPAIELERFSINPEVGDFFLIVSRLVAYKRIDVAIRSCNAAGKRLLIVGSGPDRGRLEALAGPTVEFLGRRDDAEVARLLSSCKALLFPGEEDFGLVPLEASASGRPVVALGTGGALETVIDGVTGVLYYESTPEALAEAMQRVEALSWDSNRLRDHARTFDTPVFKEKFLAAVSELMSKRGVSDVHVAA